MFDSDALAAAGIDPTHLYPKVLDPKIVMDEVFTLATETEGPRVSTSSSVVHDRDATLVGHSKGKHQSLFEPAKPLVLATDGKATPLPAAAAVNDTSGLTVARHSEPHQTIRDALSAIYDQLSISWGWWILEIVLMSHKWQKQDKSWGKYLR